MNKKLQGRNKTLVDLEVKIFESIAFIELCRDSLFKKNFHGSENVKWADRFTYYNQSFGKTVGWF